MGGLVTAILHKLFAIPLPVVLGIFSGAVTNTPALGAGQQILRDLGTPGDVVDQMGMSYAMAYPFGICGILLTMWLMRLIFRVNVDAEAQQHESTLTNGHALIQTMNIRGKPKHQQYGNSGCPDSEQRQNHLLASET